MLMYRGSLNIPPFTDSKYCRKFLAVLVNRHTSRITFSEIHGDINCLLESPAPIHPFAFRVHAHKLATVIAGYKVEENGDFTLIGKGNPQWPQAFYPVEKNITVEPRQMLAARCTYSTTTFPNTTRIGQTAGDEMCNMYLMYYTASRDPDDHSLSCGDEYDHSVSLHLPADSDVPLPRNVTLEEHAHGHHSGISAIKLL